MPDVPDLFDVLDVSLREDTYTSLIASVLQRDRELRVSMFGRLADADGFCPDSVDVHFRREPAAFCTSKAAAGTQDKPDLVLVGSRGSERRWVVIEAKISAGEGPSQLQRYQRICEQEKQAVGIAGYTLYFLTLAGHTPSERSYRAITHAELAELIEDAASPGTLLGKGDIALAWRAYRKRLERFEKATVDPATPVLAWVDAPADGFLTPDDRCGRLATLVVPDGWESSGGLFSGKGHSNALIQAWRPGWQGHEFDLAGRHRIASCFSIHFETEIAVLPDNRDTATCHLHYETRPYMPESKMKKVARADEIAEFIERRERFRAEVHARPAGHSDSGWKPRRNKLQVARYVLPTPPEMTIAALREKLATPLNQIGAIVDGVLAGR